MKWVAPFFWVILFLILIGYFGLCALEISLSFTKIFVTATRRAAMPLVKLLRRLVYAILNFFQCRVNAVCSETNVALLNDSDVGEQSKSSSLTTVYEDLTAADPTSSLMRRYNSALNSSLAVCDNDEFNEALRFSSTPKVSSLLRRRRSAKCPPSFSKTNREGLLGDDATMTVYCSIPTDIDIPPQTPLSLKSFAFSSLDICTPVIYRCDTKQNPAEAFHLLRQRALQLSAADIQRLGPHGVEQFYPYLNMEEILTLRAEASSLIHLKSPDSIECSGFSNTSSDVSVSSKKDQFWAEDSYGLTGADRIAAALNYSDDEEFMRVREEALGIDRLAIPASVLYKVEERAALVIANRLLARREISGSAFETPKSSILKKDTQENGCHKVSGSCSSCRSHGALAPDASFSSCGSPILKSTPVGSTRKELYKQIYTIVPDIDFSSFGDDEFSNVSRNSRRVSQKLKELSNNCSRGHLEVKRKNSTLEEPQEATLEEDSRESMNETDSNMNLSSVLNISGSYFDDSSARN